MKIVELNGRGEFDDSYFSAEWCTMIRRFKSEKKI